MDDEKCVKSAWTLEVCNHHRIRTMRERVSRQLVVLSIFALI